MAYVNFREVANEVIQQSDIVQIISGYVALQKKGKDYFGICPFHSEKSPSFSVSPDKQLYYCFGCRASGNVANFIKEYENIEYYEAISLLARKINYKMPEREYSQEYKKELAFKERLHDMHTKTAQFCYNHLKDEKGKVAINYLGNRKISPKTIASFGLGFLPKQRNILQNYLLENGYNEEELLQSGLIARGNNDQLYDRFSGRLMFPIFNKIGKIVGFGGRVILDGATGAKYVNSPDTPIFNKSQNLYGINFARKSRSKELILVEGYLDVISVHQAGFTNAVAALGTSFNINHAKNLKSVADSVVILFDGDTAGQKASLSAIPFLEQVGLNVKAVTLKGAKDPDEFINTYGNEAFSDVINNSDTAIMFRINSMKSEFDLDNVADKIKYTEKASKILANVENVIELNAYVKEVASKGGVDIDVIKEEVEKQRSDFLRNVENTPLPRYNHARNNTLKEFGVNEAKKHLCHLLVSDDRVYEAVKNVVKPHEMGETYDVLLKSIYEIKENNEDEFRNLTPSILLTNFETQEENRLVSEVFVTTENEQYNSSDLEKYLFQLCKTIKIFYISNKIQSGDNTEEEMQKLLMEKHNIAKLNIKVLDG